jgi:hypothetical protein
MATVRGPVARLPTFKLPCHRSYPAFCPTFDTATLLNVDIASPNVPSCPTGTSIFTTGALLLFEILLLYQFIFEDTATVKLTVVTLDTNTKVREGMTKALGSKGNILGEPESKTLNVLKMLGLEIIVLKGKKVVVPKTLVPVAASGMRDRGLENRDVAS